MITFCIKTTHVDKILSFCLYTRKRNVPEQRKQMKESAIETFYTVIHSLYDCLGLFNSGNQLQEFRTIKRKSENRWIMFCLIYWQHFCAEIVKIYCLRHDILSTYHWMCHKIRVDLKVQRGGEKKPNSSLFYWNTVLVSFTGLFWICAQTWCRPETPTEESSVITTHSSLVSPWYFMDRTWNIDRDSVCWHIEGGQNNTDFLESHPSPPSHIAACGTMHGRKSESAAERIVCLFPELDSVWFSAAACHYPRMCGRLLGRESYPVTVQSNRQPLSWAFWPVPNPALI